MSGAAGSNTADDTAPRSTFALIRDADRLLDAPSGMPGQIVGFAIAALFEGVCFALLLPVLRALLDDDPGGAVPWILGMFVAAAASGSALWITENRAYRVGVETMAGGMMHRVGNHAARLPLGWFTKENVGHLIQLVTESTVVLMTTPGLIVNRLVTLVVTPLSVVVVVMFVDWRMAMAMVAFAVPGFFAYRAVRRVAGREYESRATNESELAGRIVEFAQAQPVLRAAGLTDEGWVGLDAALTEDYRAVVHQLDVTSRPMRRYMVIVELGFVAVLTFGVLLAAGGRIGVAELMVVLVLAVRFVEPLSTLAGYGEGVALAEVALRRIAGFLDVAPLPEPLDPAEPGHTGIELTDVTFGYSGEPVVRGVDLTIPTGSTTAIVGPSGAGKTTLIRLMARAWDVDGGDARIGGRDVRDIGTEGVLSRVTTVFQHVYLFSGTIRDNVRLGRPDATKTEIEAAATASRLDEVIARLPDGWDTDVGEGGTMLSGGERQRVSIARALLKDAPILLLDEMTAALDYENEAAVTRAIAELCEHRTVVLIAHRLSTIAGANQIVYLDAGRIIESGSREDLAAAGGHYAQLMRRRADVEGWRIVGRRRSP